MAKHQHLVLDLDTVEITGLALPVDVSASTVGSLGAVTFQANCLSTDSVKDAVYITGNKVGNLYQVTKVDIDNSDELLSIAHGIIISKSSSTECVVQVSGILENVFSGMTPNKKLFIESDGSIKEGPPSRPLSGQRIFQCVGSVLSSNVVYLNLGRPLSLGPG